MKKKEITTEQEGQYTAIKRFTLISDAARSFLQVFVIIGGLLWALSTKFNQIEGRIDYGISKVDNLDLTVRSWITESDTAHEVLSREMVGLRRDVDRHDTLIQRILSVVYHPQASTYFEKPLQKNYVH
jgi:hypothetical protein